MHRRSFLISAVAATASLAASRTAWAAMGPDDGWRLAFADDFTNEARFTEEWVRVTSPGDNLLSMRTPDNVVLGPDGLELRLGNNPIDGEQPFTAGYVETRDFRQVYGYFECDMRIAGEEGVNNAFWLVSDPRTAGERHFELDVAEVKYPDEIQGTARLWRPLDTEAGKVQSTDGLDRSFHRYGLLWSPDAFEFYFDDELYFATANDFAHTPAMIRFSNAVAEFAGDNDGDVTGAATVIRAVRVFHRDDWTPHPSPKQDHQR